MVAYFLARYGHASAARKYPTPPQELGVKTWNEAYEGFRPRLGNGRSNARFRNTLKSLRDAFDGHVGSGRIGWRDADSDRGPVLLSDRAEEILQSFGGKSRNDVWARVREFFVQPAAPAVREPKAERREPSSDNAELGKFGVSALLQSHHLEAGSMEAELELPPIEDVAIPSGWSSLIRSKRGASQGLTSRWLPYRATNAKKVGDRAEEIAFRHIRLHVKEAKAIRWVAQCGETPGWDIEYFDSSNQLISVEVKGSTSSRFEVFELTENELKQAQIRREKYWLYLVSDCGGVKPRLQCIHDPFQWVEERLIRLQPIRWRASFEQ